MDKIFDRIISVLPLPVILALAAVILSGFVIRELRGLSTLAQVARTPLFQVLAVTALLFTAGYYAITYILKQAQEPKFSQSHRGVVVAQFKDDVSGVVRSHTTETLKTVLNGKSEFNDVEIRAVEETFADSNRARAYCESVDGLLCISGVYVPPKVVHYVLTTPNQQDVQRLLVVDFPDVKTIEGAVQAVLERKMPQGSSLASNVTFLERQLNDERSQRLALERKVADLLAASPAANTELRNVRRHALLVGVSNYQNIPKLAFAAKDAQALSEVLRASGVEVTLLIDPTRDGMLSTLYNLTEKVAADEQLWFYYSGHGASSKDGALLVPADADSSRIIPTFITVKEVFNILARTRGHSLAILDADVTGQLSDAEQPHGSLRLVITAAGVNELTYENGSLGHGVFSWLLLEGLRGKADANGDGVITAQEIFDFVRAQLRQSPEYKMTPRMFAIGTDLAILSAGKPQLGR